MTDVIKKYIVFAFQIVIVISFIIGTYFLITRPASSGDESLFVNDLNLIKSQGWITAIATKVSIPYLLLAYPFSFFLPDFMALRLVNVLLFLLLLLYFVKWGAIKNKMFFFYLLFYSSTGWFTAGTNDVIFVVCSIVFFNEVYKALEDKQNSKVTLLWCSLIVVFFTRELFYVYAPIFLFSLYLLYRKGILLFQKPLIPLALFVFFIVVNIPSLQKNHALSYDHKMPPKEVKATWGQRQYLGQLLVNEGKLENYQHPSWEETEAYLDKNGVKSLPISTLDGMLFDYKLTITEFCKDFADVFKGTIRQMGLIMPIILCFLLYQVFRQKITYNLYVPFVNLVMIAIFSLIIISYVESRWLIAPFIMGMLYYSDIEWDKKINSNLIYLNYTATIAISVYGIYKMFLFFI
jgi:hypothetical protein